jgi:hypothetical protein
MVGTRFQVKTYGARLVERKLLNLAEAAGDMRPAWPAVTQVAAKGIDNSFKRQGPGWAPLRDKTIRSRIAEGYPPGPILTRSRKLRDSLTIHPSFTGTVSTLEILTDVEYGRYHMQGTSTMPARPIRISMYYQKLMSRVIRDRLRSAYGRS